MTLNPAIHSILWDNSAGFVQVINFLPSYRWGDYVAIVFRITLVLTEICDWTNVSHPADLFKGILIDSNLPVTCWHPWSFIVVLTAPTTSNFDLIWLIKDNPRFCSTNSKGDPHESLTNGSWWSLTMTASAQFYKIPSRLLTTDGTATPLSPYLYMLT